MKRNKILVLLLILACSLALLVGCGGQKDEPAADENSWFELDSETGILTVRIPDETPDFEWYFVVGDEKVIFIHTGGFPGLYTLHHRVEFEKELEDGIRIIK